MRRGIVTLKIILNFCFMLALVLTLGCIGTSLTNTANNTTTVTEITTTPETVAPETTLTTTPAFITSSPTFGNIDINAYRLTIDGLVDSPLSLSYDTILQYPVVTEKVLLDCPGVYQITRDWTGVPLATLLSEAGIKTGASNVEFYSSDNYHMELTLDVAQDSGTFIAYKVDGETLTRGDGYPIRLVAANQIGSFWVRWLIHIQIS